jgi:ketosteroid isomerase-like protein
MNIKSTAAALALVFASAVPMARAEDTVVVAPNLSLHDAAVALGHDYDELYSRKDVTGMANLYAVNGELVSPSGKIIHGRSELEAYYRTRFASGATGHKIEVLETYGLGDAGYSLADFSVSVPTGGQSSQQHREHGHIAAVYAHDATGWHFAFVQPSAAPEEQTK